MKETSSPIESGFPCPYQYKAWCTTRCENHKYVFSPLIRETAKGLEEKKAGIEIPEIKLGELVENLTEKRMIDGSIKEIDCRPTFPELQ